MAEEFSDCALFFPFEHQIMGEKGELATVLALTSDEGSCCYALFALQGSKRYATGLDLEKCSFRPVDLKELRILASCQSIFADDEVLASLAKLADDSCNDFGLPKSGCLLSAKGEFDLYIDYKSGTYSEAAELPIQLNIFPDRSPLPYIAGCIISTKSHNEGRFLIDPKTQAVYRDLSAHLTYGAELVAENRHYSVYGGFTKGIKNDNRQVVVLASLPLLHLQDRKMGYFNAHGVSPVDLAAFLVMSEDCGVKGFIGPNGELGEPRMFEVVEAVKGLSLSVDSFTCGDVEFSAMTDCCDDFDRLFSEIDNPKCTASSFVVANDFPSALSMASARIDRALSVASYVANQDRIAGEFGQSEEPNAWTLEGSPSKPRRIGLQYIEECDTGATIVQGPGQISERPCQIDSDEAKSITDGALSRLSESRLSKRPHYIFNAITWLEKARYAEQQEERIINLNTALEFCVTEERGITVFEEMCHERGVADQKVVEAAFEHLKVAIEELEFEFPYDVENGQVAKDQERIRGQLKRALSSYSFNSRLDSMAQRLSAPITQDELAMLHRCNKARNGLLHGRKAKKLDMADVDMAISAAAALIASKAADLCDKEVSDECN